MKEHRERHGKDTMNARQTKRRKTAAGQLKSLVAFTYQSASRRFGKDLAKWDEASLRTYKERLDKAYPGGPGEGFASTDSRYDGLRARYTQLELLLVELDRKRCPVPLTVRGTQALVSFAPLAFKLFYAARQNAVLRRSPFPPP